MTDIGNRPRLTLAALALVPPLVLLAGPLVLGGSAQRAYQDLLGDTLAALPTGWVVFEHYDRGWFSSSAHAELALQPDPRGSLTQPLHIRLDSRVEQGPLQWFTTAFPPILARVKTRIELVDLPVDLPPLLVTTDIQANGRALAHLRVPEGEHAGADGAYRLRNGAFSGTLRLEPGASRVVADLQMPTLELLGPDGAAAALTDLTLSADLRAWIEALYAGESHLRIGSARIGPAAGGTRVDGITLDLSQTPRDEALNLRLGLKADSVDTDGRHYRNAALGVTVEGLDGTTLSELSEGLQALSSGAVSPAMRGLVGAALMARLLPRLAAAQPRITISPLGIETPDGAASARLRLGIDADTGGGPGTDLPFAAFGAWMTDLTGDGEMELPEGIALAWLGGTEPGAAAGADAPHPADAARSRLQSWVDDGWVSARDGRVYSAFTLADGLLTINGKTIPLLGGTAPGGH